MSIIETLVQDILYAPDGSLVNGTLYITNTSTMMDADGNEIPQGTTITTRVVSGAFSVSLTPNLGATPNGTSYAVKYAVTQQWFYETWIVPTTPNPANLAAVRALTPPIPNIMIPINQVTPPAGTEPGQVPEWDGTEWVPGTATFSTDFDNITTGTNTQATMTVGTGAEITPVDDGVVNANEINGITITNAPTHAGQLLISQPGNEELAYADPLVQGLYPEGSSIASPPAFATPTTIQPVLVAGKDGSGNLKDLSLDSSGNPTVNIAGGSITVAGTVAVSNFPATQPVSGTVNIDASGVPLTTTLAGSPPVQALNVYVVNESSGGGGGSVTQGTIPWVVSGTITADQGGSWTVAATQSGTWDVVASGTVAVSNFPSSQAVTNTGTFAVQATQSGSWTVAINNFPATQPVSGTLTADQGGAWTVAATQSGTWSVDQAGSWTVAATQSGTWNVGVTGTVTVAGTVTANQGTSPWVVSNPVLSEMTFTNYGSPAQESLNVYVMNPITATFTETVIGVTQSTTPWADNITQIGGASFSLGQQLAAASLPVVLTASQLTTLTPLSTVAVTQSTSPWITSDNHFSHNLNQDGSGNVGVNIENSPTVSISGTVPVSGTVTVNQGTNPWTSNIEASGVPLTATNYGSPAVEALNVYVVNPSSSVVTGTVTANQGGAPWSEVSAGVNNTNVATWTSATSVNTTASILSNNFSYSTLTAYLQISTSFTAGRISFQGSVDGTNWFSLQPTLLSLNSTISATGFYGVTNPGVLYIPFATAFAMNSISAAAFQFDVAGVPYIQAVLTQAITGSGNLVLETALQSNTVSTPAYVTSLQNTAGLTPAGLLPSQVVVVGAYQASTNFAVQPLLSDSGGNLFVNVAGFNSGNVNGWGGPSNYGTTPGAIKAQPVNASIAAGTTQIVAVSNYGTAPSAVAALGVNAYITNSPAVTVTSGTIAATQSGAWNVNQTLGTPGYEAITDGTHGPVAVKPASTAALATDPALVVTEPGSTTAGSCANTAVSSTSGSILAANTARREVTIVNTDVVVIYLGFGQTPTATTYHLALSPCTTAHDGTGGTYVSDIWKGQINAIVASTGGHVAVTEMT